ncbi:COX8 domain-containing protein [Brachionichthys hirsutus]|uniref:COX8 domain-containing protein n=1 Tax=Brachionichthys hirsutus TaxID=412623 RepID=UPI00360489C4
MLVAVTMVSAILRVMGNVSVTTLNRPKEILKETKRMIYSKPPRHKIGPGQSFFVMSVFAATLLTPAGWILHHLPEYRQRSKR